MKILVTGSSGFIGTWVSLSLTAAGHEMVPFDRPADIMEPAALARAAEGCEGIIHLAGRLGTAELLGSEYAAARVNVLGAVRVYDLAQAMAVPLVQIGTGHRGQLNTYAITKACAEDLALARAQWTGAKITVVRAFHVYGAGQKPPPPHGHAAVRKIIPSFVCRALTRMPVEIYGTGQQRIDLVHAADVADVLVQALGGPYGTVVQAGTGKATTVTQAAKDVLRAVAPTGTLCYMAMRAGEPEDSWVVADTPACVNPWPHRLGETVMWYRELLDTAQAGDHG
jgi:UDP-glucose 4-epimerase